MKMENLDSNKSNNRRKSLFLFRRESHQHYQQEQACQFQRRRVSWQEQERECKAKRRCNGNGNINSNKNANAARHPRNKRSAEYDNDYSATPAKSISISKSKSPKSNWGTELNANKHKVCYSWLAGNCKRGDADCKFLHSFVLGGDITFLTQLVGHQEAVRGICLPSNSDTLYSGGRDGTVRVWDCHTGQCNNVMNMGGEVGCLFSEGPWLFIGVPNAVKAWNFVTSTGTSLEGPKGQVHAMVAGSGLLWAGIQDSSILAWAFNPASNSFDPITSLVGHTSSVITLALGVDRLYSGSMDHTIRVWDLKSFQCLQILRGHTSVVMSLLCWKEYLLSCSLDNTVKVWVANSSNIIEVTYTHNEEHGVLAMFGMHDEQAKPVLLCSCNDNSVHLYDLPSFSKRGKIFSRNEVRVFEIGSNGLFFTGDGRGEVKVWKWAAQTS